MVKSEISTLAHRNAAKMMAAMGGARAIFITDEARVPDPVSVVKGLPPGAIVICRDYDAPDRVGLAQVLRDATLRGRQQLLIAGDEQLARAVGADGVHLPQYQLYDPPALTGFGLVTAACHDRRSLLRAQTLGVDLALVSPVFPTRSHEDARVLGLHRFMRLTRGAGLPVGALGGINPQTAKKLRPFGLAAFAAIDGFIG